MSVTREEQREYVPRKTYPHTSLTRALPNRVYFALLGVLDAQRMLLHAPRKRVGVRGGDLLDVGVEALHGVRMSTGHARHNDGEQFVRAPYRRVRGPRNPSAGSFACTSSP